MYHWFKIQMRLIQKKNFFFGAPVYILCISLEIVELLHSFKLTNGSFSPSVLLVLVPFQELNDYRKRHSQCQSKRGSQVRLIGLPITISYFPFSGIAFTFFLSSFFFSPLCISIRNDCWFFFQSFFRVSVCRLIFFFCFFKL